MAIISMSEQLSFIPFTCDPIVFMNLQTPTDIHNNVHVYKVFGMTSAKNLQITWQHINWSD